MHPRFADLATRDEILRAGRVVAENPRPGSLADGGRAAIEAPVFMNRA